MGRTLIGAAFLIVVPAAHAVSAAELVQVTQDFSEDPGWENLNNRVVAATDGPTIKQDFGWRPGQIGGTVWRTRTPAFCGMMTATTFTLNDPLSASGRLVLMPPVNGSGGAYLGFFNASRQGWRPWSSLAVRVGEPRGGNPSSVDSHVDYMTGDLARGRV